MFYMNKEKIHKKLGIMLNSHKDGELNIPLLDRIRDTLSEFNPKYAVIFEERYINGRTYDDVALHVGNSKQSVWYTCQKLASCTIPRIVADLQTIRVGKYFVRLSSDYKQWVVVNRKEVMLKCFELKEDAIEYARKKTMQSN